MPLSDVSENADDETDEPLEERLVVALWNWSAAPPANATAVDEAVAEVAVLLEGYLSGAFQLSASLETTNWWADGFVALELSRESPTFISAIGVTYWGNDDASAYYLAPFEFEFHFAAEFDSECKRIIVRFGALDEDGVIAKLPITRSAHEILAARPIENSRWAFAVEIA